MSNWQISSIKNVANIYRGASPRPISDPIWFDDKGGIGWVRISDVSKADKYLSNTTQSLSPQGVEKSRLVKSNSVIMSICATVGKPIITTNDVCIHDGFVVFENPKIDKEYLFYYLQLIEKNWTKYGQTGSQMNLNTNIVNTEKINFPESKTEQKKIAEILSTWDEAIETNEKLLDVEKQIKSVYVSNIYTKRHVTNIENVKKFEKLSKHLVEKTERNRDELTNDVLSVSNTRGFVLQSAQFEREIASKDKNNYKVVRKGQFAYNPSRVNVGSIDQLSERDSGIISPMYVVFECKDSINGRYLYHFLKSDYFLRLIPRFTQGSVRNSLSFDGLCEMKIHIPTIDKQTRYSSLLDTIDEKIDLLERNIDCLKKQKQGLMQRLLTGKVRVKLD